MQLVFQKETNDMIEIKNYQFLKTRDAIKRKF